jgi:putative ABC transport system permease protein
MDEEMRSHIELRTQANIEAGMNPEEARFAALRQFGWTESIKETCRDQRGVRWLENLVQDIRYGARQLRKNPGFTAVAVLTLALGIGANTAIFSVIHGVLVRPLGLRDADRLVAVFERSPETGVQASPTSIGTLLDWRDGAASLAEIAAYTWGSFTLEDPVESVEIQGILVTGNYFTTLGVDPLIGRLIQPEDAVPSGGSEVVISSALWRERFGADPGVLGRTLTLDGTPSTIIGVMRTGIPAPGPDVDLWIPAALTNEAYTNRGLRVWHAVGRLAPGAAVGQADADIRATTERIAQTFPQSARGWTGGAIPLREQILGDVRSSLVGTFIAVGLLLIIACVNVANLLLARATGREREMAVRLAMGASRGRVIQQLLTESLVLAAAGGAAGVAVALGAHRLLLALEPGVIPRVEQISLNGFVLSFAVVLSLATGFIFGMAPALHGAGVNLTNTLKDGGQRGTTGGRSLHRVRRTLVAAQLALTVVLLSAAGLLLRTLGELRKVDPGFAHDEAVAARIFMDHGRYDTEERQTLYLQSLLDRVREVPGVTAAGATSALPMDAIGINFDLPFRTAATAGTPGGELPQADFRIVSAGYVEAMGMQMLSGRAFSSQDKADTPRVAMINQTMAEQYFVDSNPVGRQLQTVFGGWRWYEIVGVVANTRFYGLDAEPQAEMFVLHPQVPFGSMTVVARTAAGPGTLTASLRDAILNQDPNQPPHSILPVADLLADSIASERFYAVLLSIFAAVALALATAGIYGVLSYWVGQRRREIGVRIALGAGRREVFTLVVGSGMVLTAIGIGIGLAGAMFANRLIEGMLFGVASTDAATYVAVSVVLAIAAMLACWGPAYRAGRLDPIEALREE